MALKKKHIKIITYYKVHNTCIDVNKNITTFIPKYEMTQIALVTDFLFLLFSVDPYNKKMLVNNKK